jgi:hypothetical protein
MYLKVLDFLTVKIESPPERHLKYLSSEFVLLNENDLNIEEDIRIVFVDDLAITSQSSIVNAPIGYDPTGSFWFDPNKNIARLDFNDFDNDTLVLFCSKDFSENFLYFLIIYILSFKLVQFGGHFIHSSVIEYKGKTIMFPAWRHAGKTNLMLKFVDQGAKIIADDNVFIFKDGQILPYIKKTHLLYYNLRNFPYLLDLIDLNTLNLFNFLDNHKHSNSSDAFHKSLINSEIRSQIRARIPNDVFLTNDTSYKMRKVDYVFHLNRVASSLSYHSKLENIKLEKLVRKVSETSKFELTYLYSGYNVHCLSGQDESIYLKNIESKIISIYHDAFKNIGSLFELIIYNDMCHDECFNLLDNLIE